MLELARQLEEARQDLDAVNAVLEDINWLEDERDKARAWAHRAERERDEARETILALTTAKAEADLEIATLTAALDERDVEAERSLEQYDSLVRERDEARAESAKWKAGFEEFRSRNTDLMMHLFEAQEKVRAVNIEPMLHLNSQLRSRVHGLSAEVERLMHQLADATNESTHFQVMCKREGEEIERLARQVELLTDERDELLVRVANADAELRATRESYNEACTEVRRFRDWYRNAFGGPSKRETPWDPCACDECDSLRRLKGEL
jgi:chromosome segregation ATPase